MRAWGGMEGEIKKVHEEILEGNVYVHYLDCGNGFMCVCTCQKMYKMHVYILNIVNFISLLIKT